MSYEQRYVGELVFGSAKAFNAAVRDLVREEGCDLSDCAFEKSVLVLRAGHKLVVDVQGSFPATVFETSTFALEYLGERAESGMIECTYDSGEAEPWVERVGPDAPDDDEDGAATA